ncbi:bacteriohemerythrin [Anaerophaga thermohalophila]|jgi:hemerythrin-like metal-binding protein|uniref:bacteriohemerythrin n=1 Tax=Anaerophaga thermohalophila TaxID=177400 RepID=UPI0002D372E2|nr:bacteriohemerythrin [Anaerophaga thermohalophila]
MILKWTEDLSVDHEQLDKEHQSLFEMLSDFYEGIQNGSSKEKLASLIKGLLDYAQIHFTNEEEYMQSVNFPELDDHKKEHEAFMQKANEFYEKYTSGRLILSLEVTNFIKEWITHHIKNEDKKYAVFARK